MPNPRIVVALAASLLLSLAVAAPVPVRFPEGSMLGFLVLRDTAGAVIAQGDWWQIPKGEAIEVNLRFRFTDGSDSHETFVLSQAKVWTLLSYRLVQTGPSFPRDIDGSLDRATGRFRVRTVDHDGGGEEVDEGTIELPDDVYAFGMLATILKNLRPDKALAAHAVAFTPKPRILNLEVAPEGQETLTIEGGARKTWRYAARARLGGVLGVAASIVGKQPPDLHYWMAGDPVPTFVRVDSPLYLDGPIWHVELAAPSWRHQSKD